MEFVLIDGHEWTSLLPFTFIRPISYIRIGILTLKEKWEYFLGVKTNIVTKSYLSKKYSLPLKDQFYIFINPSFIPNKDLVQKISLLKENQILIKKQICIAFCIKLKNINNYKNNLLEVIKYPYRLIHIRYPWDIFKYNSIAIKNDFYLLTKNRNSLKLNNSNIISGTKNIFLEEGAIVKNSILNAELGPIYIGKNAKIMEGCLIRGALALCEGSILNMGSRIYGDTTIGPYCKVGGEVRNSILFAYSNKAHDGFLGNSVLGEWCNLGAGTNISNLKNNYSNINVWNYIDNKRIYTGLKFCGLFMGDYSKSSINTQFNTGTVVGISTNIFGYGFPPKYIPSFSWGGIQKNDIFNFEKACQAIQNMMYRRNRIFIDEDKKIIKHIFNNLHKELFSS